MFFRQNCLHSHSKKKPNSAILLQDKSNFALLPLSSKDAEFELMLAILCLKRERAGEWRTSIMLFFTNFDALLFFRRGA